MVTHQTEEDMARIKSREWVKIRKDTHLGSRLDVGLLDKVRRSSGNGDDEWLRLKEIKLKRQGSCIIFLPVFVYFRWNVLVWVTLTLHSTKKTSSSQLRPARARSALGVGSWLPSYKSLELRSGAARDQGSTNTTQTLSQPHCIQNSVFHLLAVGLHTHCQIHSLSMRKMHSSTIIIL